MFFLLFLIPTVYSYVTNGAIINNSSTNDYEFGGNRVIIPSSCRQFKNSGPILLLENSTFIITMNCFDIVSNDAFLEAERSGNSTKDQPVDDEYICKKSV